MNKSSPPGGSKVKRITVLFEKADAQRQTNKNEKQA